MAPFWGDLISRTRGLSTRLLDRRQLEVLADSQDLDTLARRFAGLGLCDTVSDASAADLDYSARRRSGDLLRTLARWAGEGRRAILTGLFEDEDRRNLRALVRGLVQGVSADTRLEGLVPTTTLPVQALRELAARDSLRDLAALLVAWRSPWAPVVAAQASGGTPDLFRLEVEMDRAFARRATASASRGGRHLRSHFARLIDLANAASALILATRDEVTPSTEFFIEGGRYLGRKEFTAAIDAGADDAHRLLAKVFMGTVLAPIFPARGPGLSVDRLETEGLRLLIRHERRCDRLDPLGSAPILAFALRLRAQTADLGRLIWGVALAAPAHLLTADLVTET